MLFALTMTLNSTIPSIGIKDSLMSNSSLTNKLFIYHIKNTFIIQAITNNYILEYHICNKDDTKRIERLEFIDEIANSNIMGTKLTKRLSISLHEQEEKPKNVLVSFDIVKEIDSDLTEESLRRHSFDPKKLLWEEECKECESKKNHINIFRRKGYKEETKAYQQLLLCPSNSQVDTWGINLNYQIINYLNVKLKLIID